MTRCVTTDGQVPSFDIASEKGLINSASSNKPGIKARLGPTLGAYKPSCLCSLAHPVRQVSEMKLHPSFCMYVDESQRSGV